MLAIVATGRIMLAEIALVVGAAALGYLNPLYFAAVTAGLALILGATLEHARLAHEMPFYFERTGRMRAAVVWLVSIAETILKALIAGVAAILTFSGTDKDRLFWVAAIFAVAVYIGASLVRRLSISLGARPLRWGYFRLAVPLGILFSIALSFLPAPSFTDLGRQLIFELPARPSLEQASEFVFLLKQKFDALVAGLLTWLMPPDWARVVGALVSVNVLSGFVAAVHAVLIAELVRRAEVTLIR